MEELQDAIEDAQYVNAISNVDDGPRPVLPWEVPTEEQMVEWMERVRSSPKERSTDPEPYGFDWTLQQALGFFLFSAHLKDTVREYVQINFVEDVLRFRQARGGARRDAARRIIGNYLLPLEDGYGAKRKTSEQSSQQQQTASSSATEGGGGGGGGGDEGEGEGGGGGGASDAAPALPSPSAASSSGRKPSTSSTVAPAPPLLPEKTEIDEYDLARPAPTEEIVTEDEIRSCTDPSCSRCCVGLTGSILDEILEATTVPVDDKQQPPRPSAIASGGAEESKEEEEVEVEEDDEGPATATDENDASVENATTTTTTTAAATSTNDPSVKRRLSEHKIQRLSDTFFDRAEAVVVADIRSKYWDSFIGSEEHAKLMNFLWFQDRKVVEEDFFVMRVLGRGGFGLVNGELCGLSLYLFGGED